MTTRRQAHALLLMCATFIGILVFAYPLLAPANQSGPAALGSARNASLVTMALTLLVVATVVAALSDQRMSARTVAVLGVLVAVNAILRAVPGPGGFSAVFFLLGLAGYVYRSTFGFLMGTLSMLVSALIGGGVGPWLPYQMFTAGWMGLTSGWLPDLRNRGRTELWLLAFWTALWGFVFGAVMNLWFWPYISVAQARPDQTWESGLSLIDALRRYGLFYLATSAWWDAWRALGNAALVLVLGRPLIKVLRRFEHVLGFHREG
jgi:energy-coupling factor transport system substrate-specific component